MSIHACSDCEKEVAYNAPKCPHCGSIDPHREPVSDEISERIAEEARQGYDDIERFVRNFFWTPIALLITLFLLGIVARGLWICVYGNDALGEIFNNIFFSK